MWQDSLVLANLQIINTVTAGCVNRQLFAHLLAIPILLGDIKWMLCLQLIATNMTKKSIPAGLKL